MACHLAANAKILARFDSTCLACVPTSATLTGKSGFLVALAIVSAVEVFPTPGGPIQWPKACQEGRSNSNTIHDRFIRLP